MLGKDLFSTRVSPVTFTVVYTLYFPSRKLGFRYVPLLCGRGWRDEDLRFDGLYKDRIALVKTYQVGIDFSRLPVASLIHGGKGCRAHKV